MSRTTTPILVSSALVLAGSAGVIALAGPLDPPAGAVAPTYKTLTEVEPRIAITAANTPGDADSLFKITAPGSYYLTGNITGAVGKYGIEIVASGVTLDLNGFDLAGVAGSSDGVKASAAGLTNIAVVNGSVRNWGGDGIDLGATLVSGSRVERVHAVGNFANGIYAGQNSTVSACSAIGGQVGIVARQGSTVAHCSATGASGFGIYAYSGVTLTMCSAFGTGGIGIFVGSGGTISNSSAYLNAADGIATGSTCVLTNCSAYTNTGDGIEVESGCIVFACSALQNAAIGINAGDATTVADCNARENTLDGILCSTGCTIRDNTASANGSGAWTFTAALAIGTHPITVTATDTALNTSSPSAETTIVVARPTIPLPRTLTMSCGHARRPFGTGAHRIWDRGARSPQRG